MSNSQWNSDQGYGERVQRSWTKLEAPRGRVRTVAIESPYSGDTHRNLKYLDRCILDCLKRGETPYASHKMLTTALDDTTPEERALGMQRGLEMAVTLEVRAFYVDLGWSDGMRSAKKYYEENNIPYETRVLGLVKNL